MAAATGRVNNLDVHLVLGGAEPERATGNLLIDQLLGTERHHVLSNEWAKWNQEAELLEKHLTGIGRRVYRMPVGGSTPIGALGYVDGFSEIIDDAKKMKISFDTIIHASSSAGTQAGLVVGKEIAQWPGRIIGISVAKKKEDLEKEVLELAINTGRLLETNINRQSVIVDSMYRGEAYAAPTKESADAIRLFAQNCGIFLDNVYTGKAAAALIDYARDNRFEKHENILFIHTGGNIELFK
jgi:1-aminocyclopropane-1-carboxylate deaminase/D-cysteine desulfhydrase-like pyridoxal-dependent ACC family enzyme